MRVQFDQRLLARARSVSASQDRSAVLDVLEAFRDRSAGILLNSVIGFLYVAENEGISVRELAHKCRLNEATMSRAIRALAPPGETGALPPSLDLVTLAPSPRDARARLITLTEQGRALRDEINAAIGQGKLIPSV